MTVKIDYAAATSFVALVRGMNWRESSEWPEYLVAQISMVEHAEEWLPDGVVVLEWLEEPSDDALSEVMLGKRR